MAYFKRPRLKFPINYEVRRRGHDLFYVLKSKKPIKKSCQNRSNQCFYSKRTCWEPTRWRRHQNHGQAVLHAPLWRSVIIPKLFHRQTVACHPPTRLDIWRETLFHWTHSEYSRRVKQRIECRNRINKTSVWHMQIQILCLFLKFLQAQLWLELLKFNVPCSLANSQSIGLYFRWNQFVNWSELRSKSKSSDLQGQLWIALPPIQVDCICFWSTFIRDA